MKNPIVEEQLIVLYPRIGLENEKLSFNLDANKANALSDEFLNLEIEDLTNVNVITIIYRSSLFWWKSL